MARVFGRVGQILWQCNLTHSGRLSNQLDRLQDPKGAGGGGTGCLSSASSRPSRQFTVFSSTNVEPCVELFSLMNELWGFVNVGLEFLTQFTYNELIM